MSGEGREIRGFREGDERQLIGLSASGGLRERALDEWAWRYPVVPAPRAIAVAERSGTVLAWCGARRVRVWDGRASRPAAVVQDLVCAAAAKAAGDPRRAVIARLVDDMAAEGRAVLARAGDLGERASSSLPVELVTLRRQGSRRAPPGRLAYRAELARDWEPRLDALWHRAAPPRSATVVRDAEHGLQRFAGHPDRRFHRFVILPRFGREATGWVVFEIAGGVCRWVDVQWDRRRAGALALMAHLSGGVARQFGTSLEEVACTGDPGTVRRLQELGFRTGNRAAFTVEIAEAASGPAASARWRELALTAADVELLGPGTTP